MFRAAAWRSTPGAIVAEPDLVSTTSPDRTDSTVLWLTVPNVPIGLEVGGSATSLRWIPLDVITVVGGDSEVNVFIGAAGVAFGPAEDAPKTRCSSICSLKSTSPTSLSTRSPTVLI